MEDASRPENEFEKDETQFTRVLLDTRLDNRIVDLRVCDIFSSTIHVFFTSFRHKPIKRSSNYNPPLLICSRPSCAPEASRRFIAQNFREQPRSRARASSKLDISRVSPVMKTDMGCSTFSRRGFFGTVSSASQTNVYCS